MEGSDDGETSKAKNVNEKAEGLRDSPSRAEKRLKIDIKPEEMADENVLNNLSLSELSNANRIFEDEIRLEFYKEDHVDSGVCVDKSESSDDPAVSASSSKKDEDVEMETPSASSSNMFKDDLMKGLKNPKGRNYRIHMWKSALDSASDSDDDTSNSSPVKRKEMPKVGRSPERTDESRSIIGDSVPTVSSNLPPADCICDDSDSDSTMDIMDSDDDSSSNNDGSDLWHLPDSSSPNEDSDMDETPYVLLKRKPVHKWNVIKELRDRERGIGPSIVSNAKSDVLFEQRFYGSLHAVERLELMYKMNKHRGCVNSINFHPEGKLLASGSDDLNIIIWDWATNTPKQVIHSGHKSNVFQSKFLHLNAASQLNIVSCARDGQVRLLQVPPSGGGAVRRRLAQHSHPAHKLYTSPAEPHIVLSAGEDGQVLRSDVRQDNASLVLKVKDHGVPVCLHSVAGHPLDTQEICVAGRNKLLRIYDLRKAGSKAQPIRTYCPEHFSPDPSSTKGKLKFMAIYVTCAVYNHNGSEILASYNDDDIYLFDTLTDNDAGPGHHGFTHMYSGHRNCATFKSVSFFGPRSEFVVSGSDCGNIYIWDKTTEAIVQWMMGDEGGIVNSIECHPRCPILASSGLDNDIKIWVPSSETEPDLNGLSEVVKKNNRAQLRSPLFNELCGPWGNNLVLSNDDNEDSTEFEANSCRPF